jgi:hypothetical protein
MWILSQPQFQTRQPHNTSNAMLIEPSTIARRLLLEVFMYEVFHITAV